MKIIIDINHPAHINLYKNFIQLLDKNGIEVVLTVLNRGKVLKIAKYEFEGKKIIVSGKHTGSFFSIIFYANIFKFFNLVRIIRKEKPTIGFGGGHVLGAAMLIFNKKCYQFDDDPERKISVLLETLFNTKVFFPPIIEPRNKIRIFNALKEWSYLSPNYFCPNPDVLIKYNLKVKDYIFIREVSNGSLNYSMQSEGVVLSFAKKIQNYNVILSLEDKTLAHKYPSNWVILKEPVDDLHSLIYFSNTVISSGDSMAREGAMLGVLSVYCGMREMAANDILIKEGVLIKVDPEMASEFITKTRVNNKIEIDQDAFRNSLNKKWINIPQFMYKLIN